MPLALQTLESKVAADQLEFKKTLHLRDERTQALRRTHQAEVDELRDERDALAQRCKMLEAQVARLRQIEVCNILTVCIRTQVNVLDVRVLPEDVLQWVCAVNKDT